MYKNGMIIKLDLNFKKNRMTGANFWELKLSTYFQCLFSMFLFN